MSARFCKKSAFLTKWCLYSKQWYGSRVSYFLVLFSVFVGWLVEMKMVVLNENISITNHASEVRLPDLKNNNEVTICQHGIIVNFFDGAVFILSSLVTGPSFMSMSALVLELCHISHIRN